MSSGKTCLMWYIKQKKKLGKGYISEEEFNEIMARSIDNRDMPLIIFPKC